MKFRNSALWAALSVLATAAVAPCNPVPEKVSADAPKQKGLDFAVSVSSPAKYSDYNTSAMNRKMEAFGELKWSHPPLQYTGPIEGYDKWLVEATGYYGLCRDYDLVASIYDKYKDQTELPPPLPYFQGAATVSVRARKWTPPNTATEDFFIPQKYHWQPAVSDNIQNLPDGTNSWTEVYTTQGDWVDAATDNLSILNFVWKMGVARRTNPETNETGSEFENTAAPIINTVDIQVAPGQGASPPLKSKVDVAFYPTWMATATGLQNTVTLEPDDEVELADGTTKLVSDLQPGDSVMCWVRGDVGDLGDSGRTITARPKLVGSTVQPQPDERLEARVVLITEDHANGAKTTVFDAMPHLDPDNDPNAPGYQEIQQTKAIDLAYQKTVHTGAKAVETTLTIYVAVVDQFTFAKIEAGGIELAINAAIKGGKLLEEAAEAGREANQLEQQAAGIQHCIDDLRAVEQRGVLTAERIALFEKKIKDEEFQLTKVRQLATDARTLETNATESANKITSNAQRAGCFVAGTPVRMGDGTVRPIEKVKVGDLVFSKDEKSGEVAAKKVTHTSVRHNIWTRRLTFEGGSILETTDEHPLYVNGKGFMPAREAGVGTSIVTRAGPPVRITKVEPVNRRATVYNFTVADFHTYFVGGQNGGLWVHNIWTCGKSTVVRESELANLPVPANHARLWRTVEPEEFSQVAHDGDYGIHPNSLVKRFWLNKTDCDAWVNAPANAGRNYYVTFIDLPEDKLALMNQSTDVVDKKIRQFVEIDVDETPELYQWFDVINWITK